MAAMGYKISSLSSISWRQPFASHEFFKMVFKLKLFKFFLILFCCENKTIDINLYTNLDACQILLDTWPKIGLALQKISKG